MWSYRIFILKIEVKKNKTNLLVLSYPHKSIIVYFSNGKFSIVNEDFIFTVCNPNWYLNELRCVFHCPAGTYGASDERHSVCVSCHYSCASCYGPAGNECTSCRQDSVLIESNCILTSIAWKMQATSWFYGMTIFFAINLSVITAAGIYLCVSWFRGKRIRRTYDYSQVEYSSNFNAQCDADDSASDS